MYLIKTSNGEAVTDSLGWVQRCVCMDKSYIFANEEIHDIVESIKEGHSVEDIISEWGVKAVTKFMEKKPEIEAIKTGYASMSKLNFIVDRDFKYTYCVDTDELKDFYIPGFTTEKCFINIDNRTIGKYVSNVELIKLDYTDSIRKHFVENHMEFGRDVETVVQDALIKYSFYRLPNENRVLMSKAYIDYMDEYGDEEFIKECFIIDISKFTQEDSEIYDAFILAYGKGEVEDVVEDEDDDLPF